MQDITTRDSAAAPSLDHHPKSLYERLDDMIEYGLSALIGVAAAALYIALGQAAAPESASLSESLCHTVIESPFLTQVPFIVLALSFHPLRKKREIDAWAAAGWYRENFEPKHHDALHHAGTDHRPPATPARLKPHTPPDDPARRVRAGYPSDTHPATESTR